MMVLLTKIVSNINLKALAIHVKRLTLQTNQVDSTLKRHGNDRFHVVSTWNPRGVFVGYLLCAICHMLVLIVTSHF